MIASPQPNPRDGSWGISEEWGRFRQLSLVESQPRWSDWHWSADSRLVRVNLDNIDEEEECGDRAVLEQDLQTLRDIRQEYLDLALKAKSKSRESELMLGVRDKDRQIAWVQKKLRELEGQRETFFHKKKEAEDFLRSDTPAAPPENEPENFLMENTPTFFHKKGRGKNKIPPSGSLVPVVQKKRDKQGRIVEYPRVEGERVHRDLAFDYPHQFVWLYCWAIEDDGGCWQKKSKSVPRHRIWSVKAAIAANKPVSDILSLIDS